MRLGLGFGFIQSVVQLATCMYIYISVQVPQLSNTRTSSWLFSIVCALTNNDGGDGEEDEGIPLQKSHDIIFCDVLHFLLGPEQAGLDPALDLLESPSPLLRVFPIALAHGSWCSGGAGCLELLWMEC